GAELVENLRSHGDVFGISASGITLDYDKLITHSRKTADRLSKGVESLFRKNKITLVRGHGRLSGPTRVDVSGPQQTVVEAAHVLLATGSREWVPPGIAVDGRHILTSREALESRTIPARLVVIGAGAVGVEFAYVYAMYGAQVIVLEMADQMLPGADPEMAEVLQREFRRKKIEVRLGTRFEEAKLANGSVRLRVSKGDTSEELEAEQVLVAIGRRPLSGDVGLDAVGLESDAKGFI